MVIAKKPFFAVGVIGLISLLTLTGCPCIGDRVQPRERAEVSMQGDNVCFEIPAAGDKQPVHIAINPRGTPYRQQSIIFDPVLKVVNEQLCIPPSFFHFPLEGQFIVEFVLASKARNNTPRVFITGVAMSKGRAHAMPLSVDEAG